MGIRKLAQTAQESSSEGSSSCPIRRAHPGNLSGFNQLAATETGPAATEKMPWQQTHRRKLTELAVDVVGVCILQQLGSQSQKSCQAAFAS